MFRCCRANWGVFWLEHFRIFTIARGLFEDDVEDGSPLIPMGVPPLLGLCRHRPFRCHRWSIGASRWGRVLLTL